MSSYYKNFAAGEVNEVEIYQASDEDIVKDSRGVVRNGDNVNLRGGHATPCRGGLYDPTIFGSPEQCYCGRVKVIHEYCPACHTHVYSSNEYSEGYAHYDMKVPYVPYLRVSHLVRYLDRIGINTGINTRVTKSPETMIKTLWSTNFHLEKSTEDEYDVINKSDGSFYKLIITDLPEGDLDQSYEFGLIGLYALKDYKLQNGTDLGEISNFINWKLIITSPAGRMYRFFDDGGKPKVTLPRQTIDYNAIIYYNEQIELLMDNMYTDTVDRATLCYLMNILIFNCMKDVALISASKQSLIRNLVPTRVTESGRANIVGDPTLSMDEIGIPKSMMYQMLDSKIIDKLRADGYPQPRQMYLNAAPEAIQAMYDLCDGALSIFCRNPSLHKYNIMAFKFKLVDDIALHVNLFSLEGFNADFDGDQMFVIPITEPPRIASFMSMLPSNNWYYEKYDASPYNPSEEVLAGLWLASKRVRPPKVKLFESYDELARAVRDGIVKYNEEVKLGNEVTTYGLMRFRNALGTDLENIIGVDKYVDKETIGLLMSWIQAHPDRAEKLLQLQHIGADIATKQGINTAPFKGMLDETKDKVSELARSNDPQGVRVNKIKSYLDKELISGLEKLPDSNFDLLRKSGAKFKKEQVRDMYAPTMILNKDGTINIDNTNLFRGMSQRAYTILSRDNRRALELKQDLTPLGGYNQRQLALLMIKTKYKDQIGSTDTRGVLLDNKIAIGRTKLDGTLVSEEESKLPGTVRVKSCVNTTGIYVYRDELAYEYLISDASGNKFTKHRFSLLDDASIGLSFASALTEAMTQAALGLKHGAAAINYENAYSVAMEDGTITDIIDGQYVVIQGLHTYMYPITNQSSVNMELEVGKKVTTGTPIVYSVKKVDLDFSLRQVNTLINVNVVDAPGAQWGKYLEKSISRSPYEGVIEYDLPNQKLKIGSIQIDMDMNELYFLPSGYKVKMFDKLSTGVLNMEEFAQRIVDPGLAYYEFYQCMNEYTGVDVSEPMELLFRTIADHKFSVRDTNNTNTNFIEKVYNDKTKKSFEDAIKNSPDGNIKVKDSILIPILFRVPKSTYN